MILWYMFNSLTITAILLSLTEVFSVDSTGHWTQPNLAKVQPILSRQISFLCVFRHIYTLTSYHFLAQQWQLTEQEFSCSVVLISCCPQGHFWSFIYSPVFKTEISEVKQALLKANPLYLLELYVVLKIQQKLGF